MYVLILAIFYPCTIVIIFILPVLVWCFFIFVRELLSFLFFFFLFDISGALFSPAPKIVDIIIIVEREDYCTGVPLIVTIHSIVLKFFEKEREVGYDFDLILAGHLYKECEQSEHSI